MEVILLENVRRLGELGKQVRVKSGYGRNYLIPQGKAVPATAENIAEFESRRAELEKLHADSLTKANNRAQALSELNLSISRKAGAEGKLYGSVGTVDIAEAAVAAGVELVKQEVRLPDGPFRQVGDYEVDVHLHADVDAKVKISIVPEEE